MDYALSLPAALTFAGLFLTAVVIISFLSWGRLYSLRMRASTALTFALQAGLATGLIFDRSISPSNMSLTSLLPAVTIAAASAALMLAYVFVTRHLLKRSSPNKVTRPIYVCVLALLFTAASAPFGAFASHFAYRHHIATAQILELRLASSLDALWLLNVLNVPNIPDDSTDIQRIIVDAKMSSGLVDVSDLVGHRISLVSERIRIAHAADITRLLTAYTALSQKLYDSGYYELCTYELTSSDIANYTSDVRAIANQELTELVAAQIAILKIDYPGTSFDKQSFAVNAARLFSPEELTKMANVRAQGTPQERCLAEATFWHTVATRTSNLNVWKGFILDTL